MDKPLYKLWKLDNANVQVEFKTKLGATALIVNGNVVNNGSSGIAPHFQFYDCFGFQGENIGIRNKIPNEILTAYIRVFLTSFGEKMPEDYVNNLPFETMNFDSIGGDRHAVHFGYQYYKLLVDSRGYIKSYCAQMGFYRGKLDTLCDEERKKLELLDTLRDQFEKPNEISSATFSSVNDDFDFDDENERATFEVMTDGTDINYDDWKRNGGNLDDLFDSLGRS